LATVALEYPWYTKLQFDRPAQAWPQHNLPSQSLPSNVFANRRLKEEFMKKVFVGNLDFGATEDSIRTAFEAYGAVERVSLMTDRDTGRSRGFAFVEMSDSAEADAAINGLNGTNLGGRAINVNEARPKTDSPRRGGGGGERRERRW
jgi:cold-inducible RNA-binding protein